MAEPSRRRPPHHRPGGGFRNPWPGEDGSRERGAFLRWQIQRLRDGVAPDPEPHELPHVAGDVARPRGAAGEIRATWVGHATFLLQVGGWNVLTDPVWSRRVSPVPWAGPARLTPPALDFDALPPIDVVLLSHDHFDHLDRPTVERLHARFGRGLRWITPLGYGAWFDALGIGPVIELDWWHRVSLRHSGAGEADDGNTTAGPPVPPASAVANDGKVQSVPRVPLPSAGGLFGSGSGSGSGSGVGGGSLEVVAAPARHWTRRSMFSDADRLWASFALFAGDGARVFFAGDSGYFAEYADIGARLGPFDLSLIPIGAYEPRWFMHAAHMDPEEAVRTYLDVGGTGVFAGMHWGTFRLADEPPLEPPVRTRAAWRDAGLDEARLWIPAHGATRIVRVGAERGDVAPRATVVPPDAGAPDGPVQPTDLGPGDTNG